MENKGFECKCGKTYKARKTLAEHIRDCHDSDFTFAVNDKTECKICGEIFCGNFNLKKHVANVHEQKKYTTKEKKQEVTNKKSFAFECQCSRAFQSRQSLYYHIKQEHSDNKDFVKQDQEYCDICGIGLCSNFALKKHIEVVHEGKREFKCEFCEFTCSQKSSLLKNHSCYRDRSNIGKKIPEFKVREYIYDVIPGGKSLKCAGGIIDYITDNTIIEIKIWSEWRKAFGQVMAYGLYFPDKQLHIHFFGDPDSISSNAHDTIIKLGEKYKIDITDTTDQEIQNWIASKK